MKYIAFITISFSISLLYSQTKLNSPDFFLEIEVLNKEIIQTMKKSPHHLSVKENQIINILTVKYDGQFTKEMFLSGLYIGNLSPVYITKRKFFKKIQLLSSNSIILDNDGIPVKISDGRSVYYCDNDYPITANITELFLNGDIDYCFWISGTPLELYFCVGTKGTFIVQDEKIWNIDVYIQNNWDQFSIGESAPYKKILK